MPRATRDVVVIMWRDIPAQVNGQDGRERHQVLLSDKFQRAIDRAKRKAKIVTAQEDVAQWRRISRPFDGDVRAGGTVRGRPVGGRLQPGTPRQAGLRRRMGEPVTSTAFPGHAGRSWRSVAGAPSLAGGLAMTTTVLSSATREVVIGFDRPFVMIGERINPTGRKLLAEEMVRGDFSRVEADAVAQVEAGAHMLDVNAGIPLADEPALLARAVQLVQSVTDVPLSIDSSIVEALEAGLAVYQGKPLVNSVTGEDEVMERVLPLVARHGAAVVAISNDETGISEDPDVRYSIAKRIVERAADHGIPANDVVVDPLVMPIGAMGTAGRQAFTLIRRLREELKVNTTCGGSNISFGLPNRQVVTGTFLAMAIASGMTSAIMSPLHPEVRVGRARGGRPHRRRPRLRGVDPCQPRSRSGRRAGPAPRATSASLMMHRVVFTPSGLEGKVADWHDRARSGPPARRRPRHGVRWPGHLRALPGDAEHRPLRQVAHRGRSDVVGTSRDHRARLPRPPPARRRQPPGMCRPHRRRRRRRRAGEQSGPSPGRAQGPAARVGDRGPTLPPVLRRSARRPSSATAPVPQRR